MTAMPTARTHGAIRHLLADLGPDGGGMTDSELLARFVRSRDEDALAGLVRRHASMVWGVCRRLLDHHDAEDAFQATFLVLVRKAAGVPREAVANWLYGVARQTAVRGRAAAAKRGQREAQVAIMPEPTAPDVRDADAPRAVDEELGRLPGHYRAVVVLCDLEGQTRKDAARQLGIPEGSVSSRLSRARALLAKRLSRRGVTVAGSVAAVLSAGSASSAPPTLVASTIKVASLLAAGQAAGVVSIKVAAITEGVVKAMFVTKIKSVLAVALVVGLTLGGVGMGIGLSTNRTAVAQTPNPRPDGKQPASEKKGDTPKAQKEEEARDLTKIKPPGGAPLPLVKPGTNEIDVDLLNNVSDRLKSVPEKDLERWGTELERITDVKLKDGVPSPRQACRTDFAIRMSMAFDDLTWNATAADKLYKRACSMPVADAKAWKEAFESLLKEKIGIEQNEKGEFSKLAGGPPWAVPLVLIPVDALHEGEKFSAERGKKYRARLKQLTKDDVALWKDKMDKFGGTELDAAVNIILLDEFFGKERFQREKFKAAIEATIERLKQQPAAEKGEKR
jgi:RNA polymerase sigma factor (sigma-70 family)